MADRHDARWDGAHDSSITPEDAHEVAANWRDTTQLSNALDACAFELAAARRTLVTAAVVLEVLAGQIRFNPYKELSPTLQAEIVDAAQAVRAAITAAV